MKNRIIIFGGMGSGKTTFARKIAEILKIQVYSTDDIAYKKLGKQKRSFKERLKELKIIVKNKKWVLEGVHGGPWLKPALERADTIILLDIKRKTKILRVIKRYLSQKNSGVSLKRFLLFIYWSWIYKRDTYPEHLKIIRKHKLENILLKDDSQIQEFLKELNQKHL